MSTATNGYALLNVSDTLKLLGVTRPTLRRIIRDGELRIAQETKRGKQVRYFFFKHDVENLYTHRLIPTTDTV